MSARRAWRRSGGQFASRTEYELEASIARVVEAHTAGASRGDALEAMRRESGRGTRLTAKQRRLVRDLVEEGAVESRGEAVVEVLEEGGS